MHVALGSLLWRLGQVSEAVKEFNLGMDFFYVRATLPELGRRLDDLRARLQPQDPSPVCETGP